MLKKVGLFGVRKRLNQIVDLLNGEESDGMEAVSFEDFYHSTNEKLENAIALFADLFKSIVVINYRLDQLEAKQKRLSTKQFMQKMGEKIDSDAMTHALEAIEGLDARLSSLEDALLLRSETGENDETPLQDSEEES